MLQINKAENLKFVLLDVAPVQNHQQEVTIREYVKGLKRLVNGMVTDVSLKI
jgi:hypothetical protein